MKPRVSILLPVYNAGSFLSEAIESALAQTEPDFELLISDNASTDDSLIVATSYADSRIRIFPQTRNLGMVRNWNFVLEKASGEFVMLLGADDRLKAQHLAERLKLHGEHPDIWMSAGASDHIDEHGRFCGEGNFSLSPRSSPTEVLPLLFEGNFINILTVFLRLRPLRERNLSFPNRFPLLPDWRLWLDLILQGKGLLFSRTNTVQYRKHQDSVTGRSHPTYWVFEAASLVCDFVESNRKCLDEIGIEAEEISRSVTKNLWLPAQRAFRSGRVKEAGATLKLFLRYHSISEIFPALSAIVCERLNRTTPREPSRW